MLCIFISICPLTNANAKSTSYRLSSIKAFLMKRKKSINQPMGEGYLLIKEISIFDF